MDFNICADTYNSYSPDKAFCSPVERTRCKPFKPFHVDSDGVLNGGNAVNDNECNPSKTIRNPTGGQLKPKWTEMNI